MKRFFFTLTLVLLPLIPAGAAMDLEGKFDWKSPSVKTLRKGVVYVTMELKSPRQIKLAAVRVDLTTPGMRFKMTPQVA